MNDIAQILAKYRSSNSKKWLDDVDQIGRDIENLGRFMGSADPAQTKDIKCFLHEVLEEIDRLISDITNQVSQGMDGVEKIQKMADACLAYLQPENKK